MEPVIESDRGARRRRPFLASSGAAAHSSPEASGREGRRTFFLHFAMNRSTRFSLIGFAVLIIAAVVILLLNISSLRSAPSEQESCVTLDGRENCHSTDPNPYRYYGTKTIYRVGSGNNSLVTLPVGDECKATVFYLLSRHATRYPDEEYITDIIKQLPALKDKIIQSALNGTAKLCEKDVENLQQWTLSMSVEDDNKLSDTGEDEAENLARRLKEKFSSILNQRYSDEKFAFEYTSRSRTRKTAEAFAKGLFGKKFKGSDLEAKENDEVLSFHKSCKKMRKKCPDPDYDLSEIENFKNGPFMKEAVESLSNRVGFKLSSEEVTLINIACTFGFALNESDAWCSLFSADELKVFEFADDIDDYYKDSYGNKVNVDQACPIVKYMVDLFESNLNSSDPKIALQFSHAGGIKKVFPLFGLFRDELPLKADQFCSQTNRKWRSSKIAPFNTNIAFILYKCGEEHKILTLHNELPVKIDGCDELLCPFQQFAKFYQPIAQNCDLRSICCTCCIN